MNVMCSDCMYYCGCLDLTKNLPVPGNTVPLHTVKYFASAMSTDKWSFRRPTVSLNTFMGRQRATLWKVTSWYAQLTRCDVTYASGRPGPLERHILRYSPEPYGRLCFRC